MYMVHTPTNRPNLSPKRDDTLLTLSSLPRSDINQRNYRDLYLTCNCSKSNDSLTKHHFPNLHVQFYEVQIRCH